jgi:hypothetical protein
VKHKAVVQRRDKLAANLPTPELLHGSLLHRMIRHKTGCPKCERGEGHPVLVLSVRDGTGKIRHISLRPEQKELVGEVKGTDRGGLSVEPVVVTARALRLFFLRRKLFHILE